MKRCQRMAFLFGKMLAAADLRKLGLMDDAQVVDALQRIAEEWERETEETAKGERHGSAS